MDTLVIPDEVLIVVKNSEGEPLTVANLLFGIRAFARHKNDFYLAPFATNADGVARIQKRELMAEVEAHYDSGLMDYCSILDCHQGVVIYLLSRENVERSLHSRTHVWKTLLKGEKNRWSSLDELLNLYRFAANNRFRAEEISANWNGSQPEYKYQLIAEQI
ncbi:MAG: hypothetical protein JWO13_1998 [Acidobacteriales bacterium]|nr:hypothetical protein [Terriglobales bacterium]